MECELTPPPSAEPLEVLEEAERVEERQREILALSSELQQVY